MTAAVLQNWRTLCYASKRLSADRSLILAALSQSWRALEWVSDELRGDPEIMMEAVAKDWWALRFAPQERQYVKLQSTCQDLVHSNLRERERERQNKETRKQQLLLDLP